jgi:hypothetical protein
MVVEGGTEMEIHSFASSLVVAAVCEASRTIWLITIVKSVNQRLSMHIDEHLQTTT